MTLLFLRILSSKNRDFNPWVWLSAFLNMNTPLFFPWKCVLILHFPWDITNKTENVQHQWILQHYIYNGIQYLTVQWETFFWRRIAPPIWYAFSESWWYVDYYSKIEKVGCPESLLHKISKNRFMHKSQSLKKYFFQNLFTFSYS